MKDIIVVNGKRFYVETGLPVDNAAEVSAVKSVEGAQIHGGLQKSQTLNRRFVKSPKSQTREQIQTIQQFKRRHDYEEAIRRARQMNEDAAKKRAAGSPSLAHFNTGKVSTKRSIQPLAAKADTKDQPAEIHPLQQKATNIQRSQLDNNKNIPSPKQLKNDAIAEALEKVSSSDSHKKARGVQKRKFWQTKKFAGFAAGSLAVFMICGYLSYINMPNISTKIAAAQAGFDAGMPEYKPSGYQLNKLASFDGKAVSLGYQNGENHYQIDQEKSSWDSMALLNNYVQGRWKDNYLTTQEKGITIFTSNGEAAWVNGGVLYTISGESNLNNEQIRKIATSFQ